MFKTFGREQMHDRGNTTDSSTATRVVGSTSYLWSAGFLGGQGAACMVRASLASSYLIKAKVKDYQFALQSNSER